MLNRIIKRYLFLPPILLLTVRVLLSALFLFLVFNNQKELLGTPILLMSIRSIPCAWWWYVLSTPSKKRKRKRKN